MIGFKLAGILVFTALISFCLPVCMFPQAMQKQADTGCHNDQKETDTRVSKWCCASKVILNENTTVYQGKDFDSVAAQDWGLSSLRITPATRIHLPSAAITSVSPVTILRI